jgi:hypothetical protein
VSDAPAGLKNFAHELEGTFSTISPREQTSVSYAADCDVIVCYGGATIYDKHLASTVHCVDDEIIKWLKRRGQRRPRGEAALLSCRNYLLIHVRRMSR